MTLCPNSLVYFSAAAFADSSEVVRGAVIIYLSERRGLRRGGTSEEAAQPRDERPITPSRIGAMVSSGHSKGVFA